MEYLLKAAMPALGGWSKAPDNHVCDLQTLIKCARLFFVYFNDVWITKGPIHTCFWLPHFQSYAGTLPGFTSPGPAPLTSSPLLSPSPCPAGLWMSSTAAATAGLGLTRKPLCFYLPVGIGELLQICKDEVSHKDSLLVLFWTSGSSILANSHLAETNYLLVITSSSWWSFSPVHSLAPLMLEHSAAEWFSPATPQATLQLYLYQVMEQRLELCALLTLQ